MNNLTLLENESSIFHRLRSRWNVYGDLYRSAENGDLIRVSIRIIR